MLKNKKEKRIEFSDFLSICNELIKNCVLKIFLIMIINCKYCYCVCVCEKYQCRKGCQNLREHINVSSCFKSFLPRCWTNNQAHQAKTCLGIWFWIEWIWSWKAWSDSLLFSSIRKEADLPWWREDI